VGEIYAVARGRGEVGLEVVIRNGGRVSLGGFNSTSWLHLRCYGRGGSARLQGVEMAPCICLAMGLGSWFRAATIVRSRL